MADVRDIEVIYPDKGDPLEGNLLTPVNNSPIAKTYINNLPLYRRGLSTLRRGLEIGMAHGFFLIGPVTSLGPLRETDIANVGGLLSGIGLILIATLAMSAYGYVAYEADGRLEAVNPRTPEDLKTEEGWSELTTGFFLGATGGAFVAYLLLANFDFTGLVLRTIAQ